MSTVSLNEFLRTQACLMKECPDTVKKYTMSDLAPRFVNSKTIRINCKKYTCFVYACASLEKKQRLA